MADNRPSVEQMTKDVRSLLSAIDWLAENSDGVLGLAVDGSVTPWPKVIELYLPHVHHRDKWVPRDGR